MGRKDRVACSQADNLSGKAHRLDAAQTQPPKPGSFQYPAKYGDEAGGAPQPAAIGSQIHTCQDNLLIAVIDQCPDLGNDALGPRTSAWAANSRDDAVRAAGAAAVLQLEKWACLAACLPHRSQEVVASAVERRLDDFPPGVAILLIEDLGEPILFGISDDKIHTWNRGQGLRIPLSITSCHNDPSLRALALQLANGLPYLLIRAVCDRAGIDHDQIGVLMALRLFHGVAA